MTTVQCAVCKSPFALYGVEPPLEYVCPACTDPLGGPPVLSPLEERVAALEQDLRAGITRAENDLAEARAVARLLLENRSPASADQWRLDYPWLTETD
jgi:hypothetical protein